MTAPPRRTLLRGHLLVKTQGLEIGHMAGRCTRRGYATFTIATACYCQPCHPAPALAFPAGPQAGAWLAAIPTEPGTTLLPADMQLLYVAACANPCHFAGTRAALRMGVAEQSTDMAITHPRAPAQVCSPGGQRSWNMPGCVSRARRWERMARLSPSSGLHTLQPRTLELKTVEARPRRVRSHTARRRVVL